MPDREKVIKGLECCTSAVGCFECPYSENGKGTDSCQLDSTRNALELLKGQEPLTIQSGRIDEIYNHIAECPECGMEWAMWHSEKMRYCPGCGKAVKWD